MSAANQQPILLWPELPLHQRVALTDPDDTACPFHKYVGNRAAVEMALTAAKTAFLKVYDTSDGKVCTREFNQNIALISRASGGKTEFFRCLAKTVGLPAVEVDCTDPNITVEGVMAQVAAVLEAAGIPLVPVGRDGLRDVFHLPPVLIFMDEVHGLMKSRKGAETAERLLKMFEGKDRTLLTGKARYDCRRVGVVVATNRWGDLKEALRTRFTEIRMEAHTAADLIRIVRLNFPEFPTAVCRAIVEATGVARRAIGLGEWVRAAVRADGVGVKEALAVTLRRLGLVGKGVTALGVDALRHLDRAGVKGLSLPNLCNALGIDENDFRANVMPVLGPTLFHGPLMEVASRHVITPEGRAVLTEAEAALAAA